MVIGPQLSLSPGIGGSWARSIRRAEQLAADAGPAASLLIFYARVLRRQQAIYEALSARSPSGSIAHDMALCDETRSALVREVIAHGPAPLAAEARALLANEGAAIANVLAYWQTRSDRQFYAKAVLQPYGPWLGEETAPSIEHVPAAGSRCPRCGGLPQLSILNATAGAENDGSGRQLLCATCLTAWPFGRIMCAACGEEDDRKLGYFRTPAFDHVRVDACDTCRHYLKSIDLGQFGLAVPLVDEVASAPLDLWAREHGYEKIELNLVGL